MLESTTIDPQTEFRLWSREALLVFAASLLAIVAIQWRASAYEAEFARHPDEPAHFVSAALVYDYLAHGAPEAPVAYAERYYAHYPKVGIGHWPPAFHGSLGVWMLLLGVGRTQVMLFMAVVMALVCLLTYALARMLLDRVAAVWAVVLLAALPLSQSSYISVMSEAPLALACLAAVLAYSRYLRSPSWGPAVAFGLFAALGLLTKGTAVALAFVPPLAVVFLRKPQLLKRLDFWAPAAIVVVLAGPWYILSGDLVPSAMGGTFTRAFLIHHQGSSLVRMLFWVSLVGMPMLIAAVVGGVHAIFHRRTEAAPFLSATSGFILGAVFLNLALPESAEPRHIQHAAAFVAIFAAAAFSWLASLTPRRVRPLVWVLAVLLFLFDGYGLLHKNHYGLLEAARTVASDPKLDGGVLLVSSEEFGEGGFIAELALLNPHPRHVVLRGNQAIARTSWSIVNYDAIYQNPADLVAALEARAIEAVIVDHSLRRGKRVQKHHRLLQDALSLYPEDWTVEDFPGSAERHSLLARTTIEGRNRERTVQVYRGYFAFNPIELPASEIGWQP